MVYVYVNNDTLSDNELSKSKHSIDADIDKIVLENKHFRMVMMMITIIISIELISYANI